MKQRTLIFMLLAMAAVLFTVGQVSAQTGFQYGHNIIPPGAMGFNPAVNYDLPNYSSSPNIRKFVDSLPGLGLAGCTPGTATPNTTCTAAGAPRACCTGAGTGTCEPYSDGTCGQNNLGQYIPIAQPSTTQYPNSLYVDIALRPYQVKMHSDLPPTALWGYVQINATDPAIQNVNQYLGPLVLARKYDPNQPAGLNPLVPGNGAPIRVKFHNQLPLSNSANTCATNPMASPTPCLPTDSTLMGAGMGPMGPAPYGTTACDAGVQGNCNNFTLNKITIPHLHGGRTPWISDGTPHQFITPAGDPIPGNAITGFPYGMAKGPSFANVPDMVNGSVVNGTAVPCIGGTACYAPSANDGTATLYWTNQQSARLMFYHDHAWGTTRINPHKGVAAGYLLVDSVEDDLIDGTNVSGKNTWGAAVLPNQSWAGAVYRYGIPLVIQDRSFVNDATVNSPAQLQARGFPFAEYTPSAYTYVPGCASGASTIYLTKTDDSCGTDPLWEKYVGTTGGQLWMSHEYMPVENIYDPSGETTNGRWDYGPMMIPPIIPTNLTLPSPTITPENFQDTAIVNGTAFPYVGLPPDIVRFRILNAGNDRVLNLQLYKADPLQIRLSNRGSGYDPIPANAPLVTLSAPPAGGIQATAAAIVSKGEITGLTPATNCLGFTASPRVTITGGGGTCTQQITAIIPANSMRGTVADFQGLQDAAGNNTCTGFNSATPPTITISAGGGGTPYVSCSATADIVDAGQVLGVTVTNPGTGYTAAPTVTIASPAAGTPATAVASANTEVKMVDAAPNAAYPTWPADGRDGGVPDPTTQGPPWIMIGNEGGLLAQASVVPAQPIDFEYVRQNIPWMGVNKRSLLILPAQRSDVVVDLRGAKPGETYILYNDAPAPMPGFWPQNDYFTDGPDLRAAGGQGTIPPGFGPNTRTVMQIRIVPFPAGFSASQGAGVSAAAYQDLVKAAVPKAFAAGNDKPLAPQMVYNDAFPGFATKDLYADGVQELLNLTGQPQTIAKIKSVLGGNNYTVIPRVVIVGDSPVAATATASLNPAGGLTLLTAGSGYTAAPTCAVGAPNACTAATGCIQATCAATVSGGIVTSIVIDEPGAGYSTALAPTCTIGAPQAAGGVAATCSAFVATANVVGSITVANPAGVGYMTQPRVYIVPNNPGGMGAIADALLTGLGGTGAAGTPGAKQTYGVMTGKGMIEGFDPDYGRIFTELSSIPNPLTPTVGQGMVAGPNRYMDPPTEILTDGDPLVWRISHLGVDSHALHFHLFDVQVVNRVDWTNMVKAPYQDELGWRDTIRTNPQEDIIVAFTPHTVYLPFPMPTSSRPLDPSTPVNSTTNFFPIPPPLGVAAVPQVSNVITDFGWEYVYHCHMLAHEENDFMRPMVLTGSAPAAPTGLVAALAPTPVTLNWAGSFPTATGFTIQRATNTGFTANLATFNTAGTPPPNTYVVAGTAPTATTTYYFRVRATNTWGTSAWSNRASLTMAAAPPPAPTGVTVTAAARTATADRLTVTWALPAGGNQTGFRIQYSINSTFAAPVTTANAARTAVTYRSGNVPKATPYYVRVQAFNAGGSSAWVNATPFPITTP
jgi:FtsP/CotA-like multicopper oxidase with cupredoxin domain